MLLGEALMRLDRVGRDANDLRTGRLILRPVLAHRTELSSAPRRVVAGIEKKNDGLAALIAERPGISVAVFEGKGRSLIASVHSSQPLLRVLRELCVKCNVFHAELAEYAENSLLKISYIL